MLREHRRVERDAVRAGGVAHDKGHRGRVRPRIKSNAEVREELHRALLVFEGRARRANGQL